MADLVDIPELRRLLEAATPGPWTAFPEPATGCMSICSVGGEHSDCPVEPHCHHCVTASGEAGNAALIVSARNALPALLDELEALRAGVEQSNLLRRLPLPHDVERDLKELAALRAEVEALRAYVKKCPTCHGTGMRSVHCWKCDDSGEDHDDCPEDVQCDHESHALLAALDAVRKGPK